MSDQLNNEKSTPLTKDILNEVLEFQEKINNQINEFKKTHPEPIFQYIEGGEYKLKVTVEYSRYREEYHNFSKT